MSPLAIRHFFENFDAFVAFVACVSACVSACVGAYVAVSVVAGVLVAVNMMENNDK